MHPAEVRIRSFMVLDSCCFHRGSANPTEDRHRRSVFMCDHNAFVAQTHPAAPAPRHAQHHEASGTVRLTSNSWFWVR
jgi:hypothetical protein